ncbi:hypothetical protein Scep_015885 [Stephania cephalantha]|uniref:Pectate lyase n=1 Tax=Stephania cephalantha TaxID=152367 RepID=A0AAP0ILU8_9MAGN
MFASHLVWLAEVVCDAHFAASDDYSSSHRLKPPIKKISKDERRSLLQAFVLQYKASNEGKFPSTTAALKQVGGSYYFVKRTLQELQSQPPPPSLNAASTSHSTTIEIQEEVSHARTTTAQTVVHLQPKCITKEEPTFQTPAPHVNAQQTTNPHHHLQRTSRRGGGGGGGGGGMNVIDRCWRRSPNWWRSRQRLARCSVGFAGKMSNNIGRGLRRYTVTDPTDDDPSNPKLGTLRYGVTKLRGKVWITFGRDMQIKLRSPLLIGSFTTIDGRGATVHIAGGAGFLLRGVHDVIIHGLRFHHCRAQPPGTVMGPGWKAVQLGKVDGDAIRVIGSSKVWIDHNTLYRCQDGLIDVTYGSTDITISNNWFREHDKVMLLGHDDSYGRDRDMRVTVIFNKFGPNCNQRMPRVRHGYAHIANNMYQGWGEYAIGGSMNPTIRTESNLFISSSSSSTTKKQLEVTWKQVGYGWNFKSVKDVLINGAYFSKSVSRTGSPGLSPRYSYNGEQRFVVVPNANAVRSLTRSSGALRCFPTSSTC